ncbi:hypothetical protein HNQ65_003732 [Prosthecobacter vanneervenii]|uniref:Uncharacterized protein n=1 Tax=Prosthecobacter vanneervenii TaxID=48466 RepID=A0A7W7YDE0_9BACT|nr:hypothetical protein [Prosthecobacter vanneervenii]
MMQARVPPGNPEEDKKRSFSRKTCWTVRRNLKKIIL